MQKQSFNTNSTDGRQAAAGTVPSPCNTDRLHRPLRRFVWTDALLITLVAAGTALTLPAFSAFAPDNVTIFRENRRIATYPLGVNRTVIVDGFIGPVEIVIGNRAVSISHAHCPHGICMKTGAIARPDRQIVCAPNRILVTITSSADDSLDAIVK